MKKTTNKFKRSAWKDALDESVLAESAASANNYLEDDKSAILSNEDKKTFSVQIEGFRFMNKDNGFVIAYGKALSEPTDLPSNWKSRYNKNKVTLKGSSITLADMNSIGTVVECEGEWVMDPRFGIQFQFNWVRESLPSSIEGLTNYLGSGKIKGIGPATAKLIVDKWGLKTLDILNDNPDQLKEIPGLTENKIETIKKEWESKKALYQLTAFFGLYGVGEVWVPKILETLGPNALEARVKDNPYILTSVDGIGFATADKIAISLGLPRKSPKRIAAILVHLLDEYTNKNGHTACPIDDWLSDASKNLLLPQEHISPIAQELINKGSVVMRMLPVSQVALNNGDAYMHPDDVPLVGCISLKKEYLNEKSIASNLKRLKDTNKELKPSEIMLLNKGIQERTQKLDSSQIEGVISVLNNSISVLTGGPGTGKTTTLKSVIGIAESMGWEVVLAAPTGRAAKRMEEAIGKTAKTLHRCLGYTPKDGFVFNRKNPMSGKLFVVDEASMLDNLMGASWLKALPDNSRVIFVGDIDQLPSVGAGNFLKDIMQSKVAKISKLTRVHRQAEGSLIAEAAQKILAGKMPPLNGDPWTDDFAWISTPTGVSAQEVNESIQTTILSLVDGFLKKGYKKEQIQIISPQRDGIVGVIGLNDSLRWSLNELGRPNTQEEEDEPITLGDRLLVTKNNYDKDIFNGDMGIVKKIEDDGSIEMLMEDGKSVILDRAERKSLTLGYAITVHKSQGGERPVIIMTCSPSHTFTLNKNLIYTGITRGRDKVVVVGSPKTLQIALRKQEKMYRITGLVEEIKKVIVDKDLKDEEKKDASFQPKVKKP